MQETLHIPGTSNNTSERDTAASSLGPPQNPLQSQKSLLRVGLSSSRGNNLSTGLSRRKSFVRGVRGLTLRVIDENDNAPQNSKEKTSNSKNTPAVVNNTTVNQQMSSLQAQEQQKKSEGLDLEKVNKDEKIKIDTKKIILEDLTVPVDYSPLPTENPLFKNQAKMGGLGTALRNYVAVSRNYMVTTGIAANTPGGTNSASTQGGEFTDHVNGLGHMNNAFNTERGQLLTTENGDVDEKSALQKNDEQNFAKYKGITDGINLNLIWNKPSDQTTDNGQRNSLSLSSHQLALEMIKKRRRNEKWWKRWFLQPLSHDGKFKNRWDGAIIILSLWVCAILPIHIAFEPEFLSSLLITIINRAIDIFFFFDLLVSFRTTYTNKLNGEEVYDKKLIAINYLKHRFIIDLLATLPLDVFIHNTEESGNFSLKFRIIQILKLTRILRFTKIISFLTTESVKLSLKLLKLIFYLMVYIHLQACAWFFYTKWDKTWYPIPDLIKSEYHFYDLGFYYTYCFSIWHSVEILDGADMVPATGHQALVVSFLVITSEFIHAHILGTIEVVLIALNRSQLSFQSKLNLLRQQ